MKKSITVILSLMIALVLVLGGCTSVSTTGTTGAKATTAAATTGATAAQTTANSILNETGYPITKQAITLTALFPRWANHGDFDTMWFTKKLAERTNINLKLIAVEDAGFQEKKNLALASGDYSDLFLAGVTNTEAAIYGPQKIFINLTPYIQKYGPNATTLLNKYPEVKKTFTYMDGAMYLLPTFLDIERDKVASNIIFINKAWIDKVGKKMPATLDELYEVLKAFKTMDPNQNGVADEIPVSARYASNMSVPFITAFGFVNLKSDVINGKYVFVPTQPAYKDYLIYLNKLYADGLLDKEYFTQTPEQLNAKITKLSVGMLSGAPSGLMPKDEDWQQYKLLPAMTSSVNKTRVWPRSPNYLQGAGIFVITNKCKYPEAAMRLVDFLYTKEGSRMVRCGPEYGTWGGDGGYEIVKDSSGKEITKIHTGAYKTFWDFRASVTPLNLPYNSGEDINFVVISGDYKNSWTSAEIFESKNIDISRFGFPDVSYTSKEMETMAAIVDIENYVSQMDAKFIIGTSPISEWDSFQATLKKMGIDEIIKIRQAAYDRWKSVS